LAGLFHRVAKPDNSRRIARSEIQLGIFRRGERRRLFQVGAPDIRRRNIRDSASSAFNGFFRTIASASFAMFNQLAIARYMLT